MRLTLKRPHELRIGFLNLIRRGIERGHSELGLYAVVEPNDSGAVASWLAFRRHLDGLDVFGPPRPVFNSAEMRPCDCNGDVYCELAFD